MHRITLEGNILYPLTEWHYKQLDPMPLNYLKILALFAVCLYTFDCDAEGIDKVLEGRSSLTRWCDWDFHDESHLFGLR